MAEPTAKYLYVQICDWLEIPGSEGHIGFGIRTISSDPRFKKVTFLTRRPYQQYKEFLAYLVSHHENIALPPLPFPDGYEPEMHSPDTHRKECTLLREWFAQLLSISEIFEDPAVPLFCQSHLTMEEIREELARQSEAAIGANKQNEELAVAKGDEQAADINDNEHPVDEIRNQRLIDENCNEQNEQAANNEQPVEKNENHNGEQAPENDGNQSDGELAAKQKDNELLFHMDDIE